MTSSDRKKASSGWAVAWQAPSDDVALARLLEMGRWGNVRSTTLKAFTTEEFAAVVAALPEEEE